MRDAVAPGEGKAALGDRYLETRIPLRPGGGSLEGKPELASQEQAGDVGTQECEADSQHVAEKLSTTVRSMFEVVWFFQSLGMKHSGQPTLANISKRGDLDA